jgi:hypothetical protein
MWRPPIIPLRFTRLLEPAPGKWQDAKCLVPAAGQSLTLEKVAGPG